MIKSPTTSVHTWFQVGFNLVCLYSMSLGKNSHHMDLTIFYIFSCMTFIIPVSLSESTATIFESKSLPQNYLMASVGNGFIATNVYSDTIYAAGIFNGRGTTSPSHRARIPSTCDIKPRTNVPKTTKLWSLDVAQAVFKYTENATNFTLEQRIYAHRIREHIIVNEIHVFNSQEEDILVAFDTSFRPISDDFDFQTISVLQMQKFERLDNVSSLRGSFRVIQGHIKETEEPDSARFGVAVVWTEAPKEPVTIPKHSSQKWYFVTSLSTSLNSEDFVGDAYRSYSSAVNSLEELFETHVKAWTELWDQGRIEVDGDLKLSQAVYGSLYYILSSLRPTWPYGLSPGGLASNGYNGHTFWDQETWMYPPLVLLFPDMARSCLEYRFQRLQTARDRAKQKSYKGAMFPWESAVTGNEVCPGDIYSDYEQHITADIGIAAKQYWMATHDTNWLKETGADLINATAEFWASRVKYNQSRDAYVIYDVMPPDEDRGVVNNSVYTNVIAKLNLEFASKILKEVPKEWVTIATKMFIPFDKEKQYHPEYDGYNLDIMVKQADVILLGFPLMFNMSTRVRINDLGLYEPRTNPNGPAMTKSMFAIDWLDVGEVSKAERSFTKSYANVQEPFKVWTETPGGGAVNFITGAGGFLQAVLFGYAGLKLHEDYLEFNPRLLPNTTSIKIIGLDYLGNNLDVIVGMTASDITVTSRSSSSPALEAVVNATQKIFPLEVGKVVKFDNGLIYIRVLKESGRERKADRKSSQEIIF